MCLAWLGTGSVAAQSAPVLRGSVPQPDPLLGGLVNVVVSGDELTADILLPGSITGDLAVSFEDSSGLTSSSVGVSARLVSLSDLLLLLRLPSLSLTGLLSAFPVVVTIDPPQTGPLAYRGVSNLEIHTGLLHFLAGSKMRLFAAAPGGSFRDVTVEMGAGSYRVVGRKPGFFGEYVILADTRSVDSVVDDKVLYLENLLASYSQLVDPTVYQQLTSLVGSIEDDVDAEVPEAALVDVESFLTVVETNSGEEIPDEWRAARDLDNVAGDLRAAASTLAFSLGIQAQESN